MLLFGTSLSVGTDIRRIQMGLSLKKRAWVVGRNMGRYFMEKKILYL
jgi:hypothetical protein